MRVIIIPALSLFLMSCEEEPSTPDEVRAAQVNKLNKEYDQRWERQEGKSVFILEAKPRKKGERVLRSSTPVNCFHLRRDCPDMAGELDQYDMKAVTVRNKELVDDKGFFFRDKNPCDKCVP